VKVGPKQARDIGWAEAVAVELGLRMVIALGLNTPGPLLVCSDNEGVVAVINKGRSQSTATNLTLQHIYLLLTEHGMDLHAEYISTHENIANPLSRGKITHFSENYHTPISHLYFGIPSHLSLLIWAL
jgi:fatty acid-binding protein DegV